MENDSESEPLAPALSRYLNAMNKNEEDGQPSYQEPAGLDLEPGQASSATHNQAPQVRHINEHLKRPCSFFNVLFLGRGGMGFVWFIMKIWPQLVFGIALCVVVEYTKKYIEEGGWWAARGETQKLHSFVGTILAFVIGLRSNGCYDRYYEARKTLGLIVNNIREIVLESCSMFIKQDGGNGGDPNQNQNQNQHAHVQIYRNEIRRKLNIMLAFIRQNVRESHVGFTPGSSEEFTPFHEGDNFVRDPVRPRLCDLLTPAEVVAYREAPVFARAVCVASEIKGVAQLLEHNDSLPGTLYFRVSHCLEVCLDAQETLYRIITTPLPFPYVWILEVVLFLFVFSVPFLYDSDAGRYFGTVILVVGYYGTKVRLF
jgi:predicted membrane chloride channel (bestrophin family)